MVKEVNKIEDLEKAIKPTREEFQSEIVECELTDSSLIKIRALSKPGDIDNKTNIYVELKIPAKYREVYNLGFRIKSEDLEGDMAEIVKKLENIIKENSNSSRVAFLLRRKDDFMIYRWKNFSV